MWEFSWNDTSWYNSSIHRKRIHIPVFRNPGGWRSVSQQVRLVSTAAGLISIEGSAFALAVFLPPRSLLLIVNIPLQEKSRACNRLPETWHETTALHLGHSALNWRFCGTPEDFRLRAAVVIERFLQLGDEARIQSEALACVVLRDARLGPQCYKRLSMPVVGVGQSCGNIGAVGQPFDDSTWH